MRVAPGVMTAFALSRNAAGSPLFCAAKKILSLDLLFAGGCHFRPLQMSFRIRSLERAKDQVVQRRNHLRIWYSGSPNFHAVSIDVHRFIGAADDHGDWTGGRLIWIPVKLAGRDRLTLLATLAKRKDRDAQLSQARSVRSR